MRIPAARLTDEQVLNLVVEYVQRGSIRLDLNAVTLDDLYVAEPSHRSSSERVGGAVDSEEADRYENARGKGDKSPVEKNQRWIAFQVKNDETDTPIANVEVTVQLPDGSERRLFTDQKGMVKLENLDYGTFHILNVKHPDVLLISNFE